MTKQMGKESCIKHPAGDSAVYLREPIVRMFDGDYHTAIVLDFFERATNSEIARLENLTHPWVKCSLRQIGEGTLGISRPCLTKRVEWLISLGLLHDRAPGPGRSGEYLLNCSAVNAAIAAGTVFKREGLE